MWGAVSKKNQSDIFKEKEMENRTKSRTLKLPQCTLQIGQN